METELADGVPDPRAYVAIAEMGDQFRTTGKVSYRATAQAIGLKSHGPIGDYVGALEHYHRSKLVMGPKSELKLTPEGVHLAALAKLFRESQNSLHRLRSFGRPMLRLGAFHTTFRSVLPRVLRELTGAFDLDLIEAQSHGELLDNLRTGITDVAFGWVGKDEVYASELNKEELTTVRIGEPCELVAIASPTLDPEFGNRSFADLEAARRVADRLIFDKKMANELREKGHLAVTPNGQKEGSNLILCQNLGIIISLVERGFGVGVVWDMGDLLKHGSVLTAPFEKELLPPNQLLAFWRTEHYQSREKDKKDPMKRLVELLRAESAR